jgi:hypothetical protein
MFRINNPEYRDIDGRIISLGLDDGMDWIDVAQDMDRWRVLLNAVMNVMDP